MALNASTLSGAITSGQTSFGVSSATGITVPNNQTGVGVTYLLVENELMYVTNVVGTVVSVSRGFNGTQATAHGITAPVVAGLASDFAGFLPATLSFSTPSATFNGFQGFSAPVASAATITPTGAYFHVTGTTSIVTINVPSNFVEGGWLTIVFDGACQWTAGGNIAGASTAAVVAGSAVSFYFDKGTGKWYASRTA